jgi:hypothetical protein
MNWKLSKESLGLNLDAFQIVAVEEETSVQESVSTTVLGTGQPE